MLSAEAVCTTRSTQMVKDRVHDFDSTRHVTGDRCRRTATAQPSSINVWRCFRILTFHQDTVAWNLPSSSCSYSWATPCRSSFTSNSLTGALASALNCVTSSVIVSGDLIAAQTHFVTIFQGHALSQRSLLSHGQERRALQISCWSKSVVMLCPEGIREIMQQWYSITYFLEAPALELIAHFLLAWQKSWHQCWCSPCLLSLSWDQWLIAAWQPACNHTSC